MKHALLLSLVVASAAQATPSGRKWFFPACSPTVPCPATMGCVSSRCVPRVSFAATIDNTGGTTINGGADENGAPRAGVPLSEFFSRAPEAFRNWTASRVAACSTNWDLTFTANFSAPTSRSALSPLDGRNSVIWLGGASWVLSTATLGLTTTNFYTATNEIFDTDMELNNNAAWSTTRTAGTYDMESVLLHEAGHFLGLDHTNSTYLAVMYPNVTPGDAKRQLVSSDWTEVCDVYPASNLGTACTGSTCTGGLVCEGPVGAAQLSCVTDCASASATCPQGYSCRASTSGMACLPQVGAPDECRFCTSGQDCSTGVCLLDPTGVTFCSRLCVDDTQCSAGYRCVSEASGRYCLPNSTCTNQCTSPTQCAVDYSCTGGTCRPEGNPGDRCEITGYCKACGDCVGSGEGTGFCRQCCAAASSGDTRCKGCATTACTAPLTCQALSTGDSACVPAASAPGLCQTCSSAGTCAPGLICVAGRCHSECNPATPGSCVACLALTTGGGACACDDEVARQGEPCGAVAGGIAGCGQGLACVGSPQTICRTRCNPALPDSCRSGESCQLMNTIGACLPGAAGNRCAACTNANQCNAGLSCYLNRCYETCNVNVGNTCATCVQTEATGVGICGCADQVVGADEACGTQPEVHACQAGTKCLNGICRAQCDPLSPLACPINTDCRAYANSNYCQDQTTSGGGGGGGTSSNGGGGARSGGGRGGGGGGTTDDGCQCTTTQPGWLLGALLVLARRRRGVR